MPIIDPFDTIIDPFDTIVDPFEAQPPAIEQVTREGLNESQLAAAEELVRRGRVAYAETPQPQATPEVMEYLGTQPEQSMGHMGVADPAGVGLQGEGMTTEGMLAKKYVEPTTMLGKAILTDPMAGLAGLRTLIETGDADQATRAIKQAQKMLQYKFETEEGQKGAQALGEAIQPLAEPIQKAYEAAGDIGYEIAGPIGGATVKTVLAAIPEVLGLKGTRAAKKAALTRKLGAKVEDIYDELGNVLPDIQKGLDEQGIALSEIADILPEPPAKIRPDDVRSATAQDIGKAAKSSGEKKALKIAEEARPDAEILKAAEELGVEAHMLPSHSAQNPVYVALEQGLKSIPGSQLAAKEKMLISELGTKADELITEFGGEIDKALLSDKFRLKSKELIAGLSKKEGDMFTELIENLPSKFSVRTDNIINSIRQKADKLGGTEYLDPLEIDLLKKLDPATKPTYARLDNLRKKVGAGMKSKGNKIFKNADEAALKNIYKNLAEDQLIFAKSQGYGDMYKTANNLTIQRKGIEEQLLKTLGKELTGDIAAKGKTAILGLQQGNVKLFDDLTKNIPKDMGKDMRRSVFATALNDAFVQRSGAEKSLNIAGFDNFMAGVKRNSTVRARLEKEIGSEAIKRLDTIHKVVGGIRKAQKDAITTGRITSVPKLFDEVDNIATKLYGVGKTLSVVKGAAIGAIETAINAKRTPRSVAADDLLSSTKFQDLVKRTATGELKAGPKINRANEILNNLKEFRNWKSTVKEKNILDALTVNAVGYLTGETVKEK